MKFVFINTGNKKQNAGIVTCLGLGRQLALKGHDVSILINDDPMTMKEFGDAYEGVRFIYSKTGTGKEHVSKLMKLLAAKDIDYVHCMGASSSVFHPALIAKKVFRKKFRLIVDFEDRQSLLVPEGIRDRMEKYEKQAILNSEIVFCASNDLRLFYEKTFRIRAHYLPLGIDVAVSNNKVQTATPNKNEIVIGYIGSLLNAYKEQLDYLIDALAHYYTSPSLREIRLNIAGTGEMMAYYQEKVKKLNLEKVITFYGFVPDNDLPAFYSKINVWAFYLPDTDINRYRCPFKVFMYASTCLPIAASKVGEVQLLLNDYPNKVFFNNSTYEELIIAIKDASLLNNPVDAAYFNEISWSKRADDYLLVLHKMN